MTLTLEDVTIYEDKTISKWNFDGKGSFQFTNSDYLPDWLHGVGVSNAELHRIHVKNADDTISTKTGVKVEFTKNIDFGGGFSAGVDTLFIDYLETEGSTETGLDLKFDGELDIPSETPLVGSLGNMDISLDVDEADKKLDLDTKFTNAKLDIFKQFSYIPTDLSFIYNWDTENFKFALTGDFKTDSGSELSKLIGSFEVDEVTIAAGKGYYKQNPQQGDPNSLYGELIIGKSFDINIDKFADITIGSKDGQDESKNLKAVVYEGPEGQVFMEGGGSLVFDETIRKTLPIGDEIDFEVIYNNGTMYFDIQNLIKGLKVGPFNLYINMDDVMIGEYQLFETYPLIGFSGGIYDNLADKNISDWVTAHENKQIVSNNYFFAEDFFYVAPPFLSESGVIQGFPFLGKAEKVAGDSIKAVGGITAHMQFLGLFYLDVEKIAIPLPLPISSESAPTPAQIKDFFSSLMIDVKNAKMNLDLGPWKEDLDFKQVTGTAEPIYDLFTGDVSDLFSAMSSWTFIGEIHSQMGPFDTYLNLYLDFGVPIVKGHGYWFVGSTGVRVDSLEVSPDDLVFDVNYELLNLEVDIAIFYFSLDAGFTISIEGHRTHDPLFAGDFGIYGDVECGVRSIEICMTVGYPCFHHWHMHWCHHHFCIHTPSLHTSVHFSASAGLEVDHDGTFKVHALGHTVQSNILHHTPDKVANSTEDRKKPKSDIIPPPPPPENVPVNPTPSQVYALGDSMSIINIEHEQRISQIIYDMKSVNGSIEKDSAKGGIDGFETGDDYIYSLGKNDMLTLDLGKLDKEYFILTLSTIGEGQINVEILGNSTKEAGYNISLKGFENTEIKHTFDTTKNYTLRIKYLGGQDEGTMSVDAVVLDFVPENYRINEVTLPLAGEKDVFHGGLDKVISDSLDFAADNSGLVSGIRNSQYNSMQIDISHLPQHPNYVNLGYPMLPSYLSPTSLGKVTLGSQHITNISQKSVSDSLIYTGETEVVMPINIPTDVKKINISVSCEDSTKNTMMILDSVTFAEVGNNMLHEQYVLTMGEMSDDDYRASGGNDSYSPGDSKIWKINESCEEASFSVYDSWDYMKIQYVTDGSVDFIVYLNGNQIMEINDQTSQLEEAFIYYPFIPGKVDLKFWAKAENDGNLLIDNILFGKADFDYPLNITKYGPDTPTKPVYNGNYASYNQAMTTYSNQIAQLTAGTEESVYQTNTIKIPQSDVSINVYSKANDETLIAGIRVYINDAKVLDDSLTYLQEGLDTMHNFTISNSDDAEMYMEVYWQKQLGKSLTLEQIQVFLDDTMPFKTQTDISKYIEPFDIHLGSNKGIRTENNHLLLQKTLSESFVYTVKDTTGDYGFSLPAGDYEISIQIARASENTQLSSTDELFEFGLMKNNTWLEGQSKVIKSSDMPDLFEYYNFSLPFSVSAADKYLFQIDYKAKEDIIIQGIYIKLPSDKIQPINLW